MAKNPENMSIGKSIALWDGHRSVRLHTRNGHRGLATAAYSYSLTDEEKQQAARRIAALWTLAALNGWDTDQIEAQAEQAAMVLERKGK